MSKRSSLSIASSIIRSRPSSILLEMLSNFVCNDKEIRDNFADTAVEQSSILQISRQQSLTNIFDPYLLMTTFGLIENPNLMYFFLLLQLQLCYTLFSASIALSKQALKGCCMIYSSLRRNKRSSNTIAMAQYTLHK